MFKIKTTILQTHNKNGFTLLEMLVVLAIMAIIAGVSIPMFVSFGRGSRLDGAARNVSTALRTARSFAIVKRAVYSVNFDTTNAAYGVYDIDNIGIDKEFDLPVGIVINNITPPGDDKISFNSDGSLNESTAATVVLERTVDSLLKTIAIYSATGTVRIID